MTNMSNQNFSPAVEQFVDRLLAEKKLANLEPETLQQAKADLAARAEDKIKAAIFDNIPADKLEEFNRLMEQPDAEALQSFIKASIPDLEQLVAQALMEFRASYLG